MNSERRERLCPPFTNFLNERKIGHNLKFRVIRDKSSCSRRRAILKHWRQLLPPASNPLSLRAYVYVILPLIPDWISSGGGTMSYWWISLHPVDFTNSVAFDIVVRLQERHSLALCMWLGVRWLPHTSKTRRCIKFTGETICALPDLLTRSRNGTLA